MSDTPPRRDPRRISRRMLLAGGGATLAGTLLLGRLPRPLRAQTDASADRASSLPSLETSNDLVVRRGGAKPVYLPPQGTAHIGILSRAEHLFWSDILMEHARFIGTFLAGPELADLRAQAGSYETMFAGLVARAMAVAPGEGASLNRDAIALAKSFVDFKHDLHDRTKTGRLRTLAYPSFYEHTAREGQRYANRLALLSAGQPMLERSDVIGFWSQMLGDHMRLLAHMLDPVETALINTALRTAGKYDAFDRDRPADADPVIASVEETIDFKTSTERGIDAGTIQSIMQPALADHHRREAIKAADELRRVAVARAGF